MKIVPKIEVRPINTKELFAPRELVIKVNTSEEMCELDKLFWTMSEHPHLASLEQRSYMKLLYDTHRYIS